MTLFAISDTHFSHKNILKFARKDDVNVRLRDFETLEEMNELMIENWNKTVRGNDIIIHGGDFTFGGKQNIGIFARRLRGRKWLVMGNHDYNAKDYVDHFEKVMSWHQTTVDGVEIVTTHAPLYRGAFDYRFDNESINVHGHLPDANTPETYHVNVCVENTNYTPVALEDIVRDWRRES